MNEQEISELIDKAVQEIDEDAVRAYCGRCDWDDPDIAELDRDLMKKIIRDVVKKVCNE